MDIRIVALSNSLIKTLQIDECSTVRDVKAFLTICEDLTDIIGLYECDFELVYKGEIMDFRKEIHTYGVKNNDEILLIIHCFPDDQLVSIEIGIQYIGRDALFKDACFVYTLYRNMTMIELVKYISERYSIHNQSSQVIAILNSIEFFINMKEDDTIDYLLTNYKDFTYLNLIIDGFIMKNGVELVNG